MSQQEACPFAENSSFYACYKGCRAERMEGKWKICTGSRFDPLPLQLIEVIGTLLTDEAGYELYEVYEAKHYKGSVYAASEAEALEKARNGQELTTGD